VFLAVPLLVAAAAGRRRFAPVLAAVSMLFTLNLVFYGVSDDGRITVPRMLTVVDTTLLLSLLGCVTLFWFASVLRAECRSTRISGTGA
jgi:hypothetical protein